MNAWLQNEYFIKKENILWWKILRIPRVHSSENKDVYDRHQLRRGEKENKERHRERERERYECEWNNNHIHTQIHKVYNIARMQRIREGAFNISLAVLLSDCCFKKI